MLRIYSNIGPHSAYYDMQGDAEDLFLPVCSRVLTLEKLFFSLYVLYRGGGVVVAKNLVRQLPYCHNGSYSPGQHNEWSISCHTCCDTELWFMQSHPKDHPI
jgi:hypothetical protein